MMQASKIAIIALLGLPIFSMLIFPILYIKIHEYVAYSTQSSSYFIRKTATEDFDKFEPDVTSSSFRPLAEDELLQYPQVQESMDYFEGKLDDSSKDVHVYCDIYPSECVTSISIKNTEGARFWQDFEFDQCNSLFAYHQNYYLMSCFGPIDPPSYYFDAYDYSYLMILILIGFPLIAAAWIFQRWYAHGSEKMA